LLTQFIEDIMPFSNCCDFCSINAKWNLEWMNFSSKCEVSLYLISLSTVSSLGTVLISCEGKVTSVKEILKLFLTPVLFNQRYQTYTFI
jgi:hypothetical protein